MANESDFKYDENKMKYKYSLNHQKIHGWADDPQFDRVYLASISYVQCFQASLHYDDNEMA